MLSATQLETFEPDVQVRFRMEVTDMSGAQINAIEAGKEFSINVYVSDQRPIPQGVFAAYLDLIFDHSLVERTGPVTFGDSYTNALASGGSRPGVLDEVGAVTSLFESGRTVTGTSDPLLFRVPFRAIDAGPVTFLTEPADHFPESYVLLFGINEPIELSNINFDVKTIDIVKPPSPVVPTTLTSLTRDFTSLFAWDSLRDWGIEDETDLFAPLKTTSHLRADRDGSAANSSLAWHYNDTDRELTEELSRVPDILPENRLWSLSGADLISRMRDLDSAWIDLSLPQFTDATSRASTDVFRSSLFDADEYSVEELRRIYSEAYDSNTDCELSVSDLRRTFLRIGWLEPKRDLDAGERLSAHMIDIDAILAEAELLDELEVDSDELIAEVLRQESSDQIVDRGERPRIDLQLKASRSTSLAVEVGVGPSDPPRVTPAVIPQANSDSERADAGPPKPSKDLKEVNEPA